MHTHTHTDIFGVLQYLQMGWRAWNTYDNKPENVFVRTLFGRYACVCICACMRDKILFWCESDLLRFLVTNVVISDFPNGKRGSKLTGKQRQKHTSNIEQIHARTHHVKPVFETTNPVVVIMSTVIWIGILLTLIASCMAWTWNRSFCPFCTTQPNTPVVVFCFAYWPRLRSNSKVNQTTA